MTLFEMSISGGIFVLFLLLVRHFTVTNLPKRTFSSLWLMAILRFLVPFNLPFKFSVTSLLNLFIPLSETTLIENLPLKQPNNSIKPSTEFLNSQINLFSANDLSEPLLSALNLPQIIYFAGVFLCILFFTFSYIISFKKFKKSYNIHNDFLNEWLIKNNIKRKINFKLSSAVSAPITYGFFRPTILIPSNTDFNNKDEIHRLNLALLHEFSHISRCDYLKKLLSLIVVSIHWLNPMAWILFLFMGRDLELASDEFVLRKTNGNRSDYARALISFEESRSARFIIGNNFNNNLSEERIIAIMKTKPLTLKKKLTAIFIVMILSTLFLTSGCSEIIDTQKVANSKAENNFALINNSLDKNLQTISPKEETTNLDYNTFVKNNYEVYLDGFKGEIDLKFKAKNRDTDVISLFNGTVVGKFDNGVSETSRHRKLLMWEEMFGNCVLIECEDGTVIYNIHLDSTSVNLGDSVKAGDIIGKVGKTGRAYFNDKDAVGFAICIKDINDDWILLSEEGISEKYGF